MSDADGISGSGVGGEGRGRSASEYWLVRAVEENVVGHGPVFERLPGTYSSPADAWAQAESERVTGTLHVVCHRGTKVGGSEYRLK